MDCPFKVGDKVYHIFYGEGVVKELNCQNHVKDNGRNILVNFPSVGLRQYSAQELSFSPWAKADHQRTEVWICHLNGGTELLVRAFVGRLVYVVGAQYELIRPVQGHGYASYNRIKQLK